MDTSNPKGTDG